MAEVEKEAALEEPMLEETTLALEEATPTLEETTPTLEETSEQKEEPKYVKLGPKGFDSSTEMFEYFYDLVQGWNLNLDINEVCENTCYSSLNPHFSVYSSFAFSLKR